MTALKTLNIDTLAQSFEKASPIKILRHALESFEKVAISFSGAEDVVLIDMASSLLDRLCLEKLEVFTLDTGRLHPETLEFIDKVRNRYPINLHVMSPNSEKLEAFTKEKGLFSFFQDGHKECCSIRKVEPLRRALSPYTAWITGQRKDQSPTRNELNTIEYDVAFSTHDKTLIKYNPLANWSSKDVWDYIRDNDVPYNILHEQGFKSIGCQPCTKAILPNQHEREGRWWWEEATKKECGLHK